ncbi:LAFE_0H02124g1_1 [Lachancea fermentati]|uniref:LAFE_0H02124g1_1 n=1 Tax=Lachancea fermentati TaxID=4955 RepID=A0A1G4MJ81_LACFM|nr:LAFE_0H02124g1_1 [Lachancea fermentati]
MSTSDTFEEGIGYESYSCARCRRLKKKCSKELPVCKNCSKAGESCLYPGRAPRRTKRELEEARARGEFIPSRRLKRNSSLDSESATENVHSGSDLPTVANESTSIKEHPESLEAASSFLNMLASINGRDDTVPAASPSIMKLVSTEGNDKQTTYPQGKLEHELHKPDSIPIKPSSIQIEAITAVFKGGRTTPMVGPDEKCRQIERPLYDRFIAAYFKHNHRSYPLINKIEFLNKVSTIRDFTDMEGKYDDTFIFQLYMVMAIGCTTLQRAGIIGKNEEGLSEHFSYLAMRHFCKVMHLQNVETITCLLLLGIYSFFEPKGNSSWTISGIMMRLTIGLGLHKALTTKKMQSMSVIAVEIRYRAFWSFYCFERLVHTSLGRVSAIDDDDISVPLPRALYEEEVEDIEVTKMMISLRRIGGQIYKQVHSVGAGKKKLSMEEKQEVIQNLRKELDMIYTQKRNKIQESNSATSQSGGNSSISFHSSDIWLAMRYAQLQIMLYRPSALIPKPPMESLSILGDSCLRALKHTYTLYKKKLQPLNWITLFRTLTICNTMLYCLCQWSIDLIESKIEIQQCAEILQHFGEKWVFAAKCADVFQTISNAILDISLSNGQVPNMDKLTSELFGASNEYQDILDENNVDISWVDRLV